MWLNSWPIGFFSQIERNGFRPHLSMCFLIGPGVQWIALLETCPFISKCIWERGELGRGMGRNEEKGKCSQEVLYERRISFQQQQPKSIQLNPVQSNPTQTLNIEFSRETFLFPSSKNKPWYGNCCFWDAVYEAGKFLSGTDYLREFL